MAISSNDFGQENAGSDSDASSDDATDYYQPISAVEEADVDSEQEIPVENDRDHVPNLRNFDSLSTENPDFRRYPNGNINQAENGISRLDLNNEDRENDQEEEEEVEEEMTREASDIAISRAFREDESRRNAPLAPENAVRIVEAMRAISFEGFTPDWANQVPEDHWIDQLRRLRQPSTTATP